jgi:hypothetical protein
MRAESGPPYTGEATRHKGVFHEEHIAGDLLPALAQPIELILRNPGRRGYADIDGDLIGGTQANLPFSGRVCVREVAQAFAHACPSQRRVDPDHAARPRRTRTVRPPRCR